MSNDKYHILLVDDDDKIRDLLQKYLIENITIISDISDNYYTHIRSQETKENIVFRIQLEKKKEGV